MIYLINNKWNGGENVKKEIIKNVNLIIKKYKKDFKRKDLSFELMTIQDLIEACEDNDNLILEFLFEEFKKRMQKRYEKLNSQEYKEKNIY